MHYNSCMNITTLFNLSSGFYIIGTKDGSKNAGCIVNTVMQSSAEPVTITVCINKANYTNTCIKKTGKFSVSILSEKTKESTIKIFGFSSSRDRDKFAEVPLALTPAGLPYINEGVSGYLQCKVIGSMDNFTHTIFIAEVEEAENLLKEPPMTYAYYHKVFKGKPPKNASNFTDTSADTSAVPGEDGYICTICGWEYPGSIEEFEKLPDSYVCPVCKMPKSKFMLKSKMA